MISTNPSFAGAPDPAPKQGQRPAQENAPTRHLFTYRLLPTRSPNKPGLARNDGHPPSIPDIQPAALSEAFSTTIRNSLRGLGLPGTHARPGASCDADRWRPRRPRAEAVNLTDDQQQPQGMPAK